MIRHRKKLLVGMVGLLLGGAVFGPGISDASRREDSRTVKKYTATGSGARMYGGVALVETITLKNTTSSNDDDDLGFAKVTVPAGLHVNGTPTAKYYSKLGVLKPWRSGSVLTFTAGVVKITGLDVDPGESVVISISVDSCSAGSYNWTTETRVSSATSSLLTRVGTDPVSTIAPADACRLAFTGQPTDNFPTGTITTVPYSSVGDAVTVTALDGLGAPLATWASPITIALAGGDAPTTLNNATVTQTGATATIAPNIGAASVVPYHLTASTTGLASVDSADFTILYKAIVQCDGVCSTPEVPGPGGGSAGATTDDGVTGELVLEWDPDGGEVPNCPNYQGMANTVFFNLTSAADLSGHTKTVTLNIPHAAGKDALSDYQVCYRAPYAFNGWNADTDNLFDLMTADEPGAHPADQVATDRWQGLLFNCSLPGATSPCILSRTGDPGSGGGVQIKLRVPAGDPWAR